MSTLEAISNALDVRIDYFLDKGLDCVQLSHASEDSRPAYRALVKGAKKLTDAQQQQLLDMARVLFKDIFDD